MQHIAPSIALLLAVSPCVAGAGELCLTREGQPAATIVLADSPTAGARFAAAELQYHVRRISGADLPIVSESAEVAGTRVLVGQSGATRAMGLPDAPLEREEYVIHFGDDCLALLGRDDDAGAAGSALERSPGKFGDAARFDGNSTVVTAVAPGLKDERGSWEAWVWMPKAAPDRHGTILRVDGGDPWTYHILQRDAGSSVISYTTYDGANGHGVRSQPLAEGWHQVLGTWDAAMGTMALYVDGLLCGTTDYVKTTCAGAAMGIGGITGTEPVSNCFVGLIDEVRVSRTVRDPQVDAGGGPYAPDSDTGCLYHFDEPAGQPMESVNPLANAPLPGMFQSNGTLYAVYDFLERQCGVRWYAPGEIGIVCRQSPTLIVSGTDRRHKPAMEMRTIAGAYLYMPTGKDRVPDSQTALWKLRMRLGGLWRTTGHSFYHYPKTYLAEHPDWFARTSADGAQFTAGEPSQMCYSNDGFIRQAASDAIRYFDGKGHEPGAAVGDDTFGLVPMDNSTWCKCAACQAQLNATEKDNPQFNNGWASDYIYEFTNRVAREVGKVHPDKWIGQLAYSTYAYHPEKVKLEPNIAVQMCLHTRNWWCPSMEANDRKLLSDWRRLEPQRPLYLWLYYCFPALNARSGNFHYFPGFFAHQVVGQMRLYHEAGIRGIFLENSSECDATYLMDQLEYYVTFKLADDPTLDGNRLIDEFFSLYYGAAAEPMRALYCGIEDLFTNPEHYPPEIRNSPAHQHQTEELAWEWLGTAEHMARLQELMDQAVAAAQTDTEKERVRLFRVGIWDYMVEGRAAYEQHQQAQAEPPVTVEPARLPEKLQGAPERVNWAAARTMGGWGGLSGDRSDRRLQTLAAQDGEYLYLELSEWTDPRKLVSGGQVWDGDDFEVIIASGRGAKQRHQLVVAPNGSHVGLAWDGEELSQWASGAVVASDTQQTDRWVVRIALPLSTILPGGWKPGQSVFLNCYAARPATSDLLAWQPVFAGGFHNTERLPEWVMR